MAADTFHRFNERKKRKPWIHYCNEILFWILQGLIIFYILYLTNYGQIRFYIWLALIFGFAFYQALLRVWYLKVLEHLIQFSVTTWQVLRRLIQRLVIAPLSWMLKVLTYLLTLFWTAVIWVLFIPWKLLRRPLIFVWNQIKKLIPENVKKYILSFLELCSKIINNLVDIWKSIFAKRR
ncbi:spore cortex biosynthesis protein YabQ [Virgibacillus sp. MSP4-1]|uniref:spore cortex biosynthesis protein YabQ n=1 Tax=Virgibacillus sp. MSP4-1 TaxID=2700081 RepID=UPI00351BD42E